MSDFQRDFKGIWIPKEIWLDTRLNALDKMIYAEINSLDIDGDGCYASNEYLAEFCQCSERRISDAITKLKNCGYICVKSFNGRQRVLSNNLVLGFKNCEAESQNLLGRVEKSARQTNILYENHRREYLSLNKIKDDDKYKNIPCVCAREEKSSSSTLDNLETNLNNFLEEFGIMLDSYTSVIAEIDFELLTERFRESEWLKANISSFKKVCEYYPKIISGYYKDYDKKPREDKSWEMLKAMLNEAKEEENKEQGGTT